MKSKLTLRMDEDVKERAKEIARKRGTSLSALVENYFRLLSGEASSNTATYGVDPRPLFEYLSTVLDFARMGWPALSEALEAPAEADFEDEYIAAAGAQAEAEIAVPRNADDFRDGPLTAYHPEEMLEALG